MNKQVQGKEFLTTANLCKLLDISVFTLWRRRDEGYFVMGIHYFKTNPEKKNSQIIWDVEKVLIQFSEWKLPSKDVKDRFSLIQEANDKGGN
jgi:hypothetical protein